MKFKVILMMRDPRDQTVSRLYHIRRDPNHRWHLKIQNMGNDEALMACIEGRSDGLASTKEWINSTKSWLREKDKFLPVKYEDLIENGNSEFKRVLEYLNISFSEPLVKSIVNRNRFDRLSRKPWQAIRKSGKQNQRSHFRKGIVGDWKNHFSEEHISRYKKIAGDVLIEWKYEENCEW